jgi:hypothetical protein
MVPTEFVKTAVAMLANAMPQLLYLTQKVFARHLAQIFVHQASPVCCDAGPAGYAPSSAKHATRCFGAGPSGFVQGRGLLLSPDQSD